MASGTVVVTGASSGIGEASVRHLTQLGFEVRAGVRKQEDAERLRSQGVKPLMIDVTDADSIAVARDQLGGRPLAGLVNNAGVAVSSPLEHVPIDSLRDQLEINLIGQIAVTQAFLPGLRAARGRIVMVSSIGGRMALPLDRALQRLEVRPGGRQRRAPPGAARRGRGDPGGAGSGEDADLGQGQRGGRRADRLHAARRPSATTAT